jgi:uncharacterized protein YecE (DUF72 family)
MDELRIGSCSWKYPSWKGLVYEEAEPENFLAQYARRYDSVEVDQWFWSLGKSGAALPRRETAAEYDAATPDNFRSTVKCPNALTLTHQYAKKGQSLVANARFLDLDFFNRFVEALDPIVPKIGLFMFQFEYLNQAKMPGRQALLDALGPFLGGLPRELPYAVELRNPRWMDAGYYGFLREQACAPVLTQGYWMDDAAALLERYGALFGPALCLRLHGEDREGMEAKSGEDWSRIIRPKDEDIERVLVATTRLLGGGRRVYLNVNNHYEGSAPLTIAKIRARLEALREGRLG